MAYLVIGAYGVSFRKIVKVYCGIGMPFLMFCIVASQTGLVKDLVFDANIMGRGFRHSFGIIYPTDFAAHVTYLVLGWGWLRGRKLTWAELGVFAFCTWAVYHFCNARTSVFCLSMLLAVFAYIKLNNWIVHLDLHPLSQTKVICSVGKNANMLMSNMVLILSAFMLVFTLGYSDTILIQLIDHILNGRLSIGRLALGRFGISIFGQQIPMQGNGYMAAKSLDYYFFIDCSYIKMLVCYGLVVSIFIWIAYTLLGHRAIKANDIYLIWVIGVIGLHCAIEHHLMEIAYNPFLLAVFAKWGEAYTSPEKKPAHDAEKHRL